MPDYVKPPNPFRLAAPGSDGWFEIVGVVGDTPNVGLHEPPAPSIYVPYTLMLSDSLNVILRTSRDPLAMTRSIREAVRTVDPNQPVSVYTAEDALASAGWARERFVTLLLLGFAMFALMLAVVGLYSVVSYSVSCRFKEFGIRMALGAGRGRIVNAAVQPAVLAIVAGLFAGLALSVGLNKVVAQWSIGNLNDPVVLVAVSLVLFVADDDVRRDSSEPSCLDSAGRRASDRLNKGPPRPTSLRHAPQALNLPQPSVELVPTRENAAHHFTRPNTIKNLRVVVTTTADRDRTRRSYRRPRRIDETQR